MVPTSSSSAAAISPISSSSHAPTTAGAKANYALATAEAHRLHDLAARPPGAVITDRPPATLSQSAMGTPGTGSLIDVVSFWEVPMSQHESDVWIAAHAPAGLDADFSSPGIGGPAPADIVTGRGFTAPNAAVWNWAALEESVAVLDGDHSVWRVEGEAIWLDPTPVAVHPAGPTMRVTVRGGCPHTDRGIVGVANQGTALDTALLPAGQPTAGLVCRYAGGDGVASSLIKSAPLTPSAAAALAHKIRDISLAHDSSGAAHSCPMDDGAAAVVAFSYPGRPDVDLWVRTNGCSTVNNGWILADGNPLS